MRTNSADAHLWGYGFKGALEANFTKNDVNGLRIKVLTSKADPQMDGILENLEEGVDDRTKGLKILKIKRDELLAVFNKSL